MLDILNALLEDSSREWSLSALDGALYDSQVVNRFFFLTMKNHRKHPDRPESIDNVLPLNCDSLADSNVASGERPFSE